MLEIEKRSVIIKIYISLVVEVFMDSIKIEMGAVLALKNVIQLNDYMKEYINDNDKEPSWDGHIYLYNSENMKAENIEYKIPVQIKGKNDENLLDRQRISFPVEYKHLRNYFKDGGVFYIVVVISNDRRKTTIFYNALTSIKLGTLLKGSEGKQPDQTKSVVLEKLKNKDDTLLLKILMQFGFDRSRQGSGNGEIVKKAININVLDKVDSVQVTSYIASNEEDALQKISSGELCLYGHRSDIDMWLPFSYENQRDMQLKKVLQMDKSVGIDGAAYYKRYWVESFNLGTPIVRVSENLAIDLVNGKLNFEMHANIEKLMADVAFLYAVLGGHAFWVGDRKISEYNNVNLSAGLRNKMELISDFYNALKEIDFYCEKRLDDFTDKDWKSVKQLINIYHRKIKLNEDGNAWCMWWWDGKVVPLLAVQKENGEIEVINWLAKEGFAVFAENDMGEQVRLPRGVPFKRDIWENLYDIDESIILNDIERCDYTIETENSLYLLFVEILAAYDVTKAEKYYDMATLIITKLLEIDKDNEFGIINHLQLLKRKREFTNEEIIELEKMEEKTSNDMVICAVNILLENKHKANKLISKLSERDQETFKAFPIYNLL